MAWTAPRTWVTGEVVTAVLLNTHVRDNLIYLKGGAGTTTFDDAVSITKTTGNTLVVDTSTLVVDAANNRVGIGTTAPLTELQVGATTLAKTAIGQSLITLGSRMTVNDVHE